MNKRLAFLEKMAAEGKADSFALYALSLEYKAEGRIDDALAKQPALSAEQLSEVKKLRAEGEALHKAGKHQESLDTLDKAEKILGI